MRPATRDTPMPPDSSALMMYGCPLTVMGYIGFRCPLVVPEERADNPDLRIGTTELIVADVLDHQPVWTGYECDCHVAELAGLPRVQPRPVRVKPYFVGPAITQVLPGGELLSDWKGR